jgi:hypothetical protein
MDPYGRNLGFLHRSRYFFFQAVLQLYSRGSEDPYIQDRTAESQSVRSIWTSFDPGYI